MELRVYLPVSVIEPEPSVSYSWNTQRSLSYSIPFQTQTGTRETFSYLRRAGGHAVERGYKLYKVQVSIVILVKCGEYKVGNTRHTVWREDQT